MRTNRFIFDSVDNKITNGFYKKENDQLIYGPNFVLNMNYELRSETHDQHTYPVDGWYWFDSDVEAYAFFGVSQPEEIL